MDIIRIIFAIILPPLGVFLQVGLGKHFWINIILTIFGFLPGIIHAVWIIAKKQFTDSVKITKEVKNQQILIPSRFENGGQQVSPNFPARYF